MLQPSIFHPRLPHMYSYANQNSPSEINHTDLIDRWYTNRGRSLCLVFVMWSWNIKVQTASVFWWKLKCWMILQYLLLLLLSALSEVKLPQNKSHFFHLQEDTSLQFKLHRSARLHRLNHHHTQGLRSKTRPHCWFSPVMLHCCCRFCLFRKKKKKIGNVFTLSRGSFEWLLRPFLLFCCVLRRHSTCNHVWFDESHARWWEVITKYSHTPCWTSYDYLLFPLQTHCTGPPHWFVELQLRLSLLIKYFQ